MRLFTLLSILFLSISNLFSQPCDTNALQIHKVSASTLDANITPFELNRHHAFFNTSCTPKNKLVFYIVGTYGNPKLNLLFTKMAANYGYHVISIKYPNNTSATTACATENDTTCYENFHKEIIFGTDLCPSISVDSTNSIYTRSVKLLEYLTTTYPSENWDQFMIGNDIDWTKVITAGHSQGAGHSAYLSHIFPVQRGLMFAGPNEFMNNYGRVAPWFSTTSATADSNLYSFSSIHDELSNFSKQYAAWAGLGIPNNGDTVDVIGNNCPYNNTRALYTTDSVTDGGWSNHGAVVSDDYTPLDIDGYPLYQDVWKYMLGICDISTNVINSLQNDDITIFPIPAEEYIVVQTQNLFDKIEVINSLGETVFIKKDLKLNVTKIDISQLEPGIYFIKINSDKSTITKKVILQ
jgi:hypothetical protein